MLRLLHQLNTSNRHYTYFCSTNHFQLLFSNCYLFIASVSSSGDQATFVASGSSSLQKYTNVANPHLLQK
jgi:hypothetical protein